jgi:Sel1 repeat
MISRIRQARDTRTSPLDYAPPWARVADRAHEQTSERANFPVRHDHAVVEVTRQRPLDPAQDWQGADQGRMSLRLIALQMGVVSGVAALVAWVIVSIFGPKSPADETAQLRRSPPATAAASVSSAAIESRMEAQPANPAATIVAGPRESAAGPTSPTMGRSAANAAKSLAPAAAPTMANPSDTAAAPAPPTTASPARVAAKSLAPAAPPTMANPSDTAAAPAPPTASPARAAANPAPPPVARPAEAAAGSAAPTSAPSPEAAANPAPPTAAARTNMAAEPAPNPAPSQTKTASASPSQVPAADTSLGLGADELTGLLKRAQDFINAGDFSGARLLLRRAAEAGSAEAAVALGATFDPNFLRKSGAVGIEPDVDRARQWYQKAAELGSPVAAKQLESLPPAQ